MQLIRYGAPRQEKPGLIDQNGIYRDLSHIVPDWTGETLTEKSLQKIAAISPSSLPELTPTIRLGSPVANVGKVIGVALNYRMHAAETGSKVPSEPVLFLKAPSAICGPNDDILLPRGSEKTDWEVELGVVIGKTACDIPADQALDHIAGYCVLNDVSERAFQLERGGQQHTKGKSADTFCPLGPVLVTRNEIPDPQKLRLWTKVNGTLMQDGTTADMLFPVAQLISYISEFMTLLPGDVIATGTPDGVGKGRTPPLYLKENDILEQGIDALGQQKHLIKRKTLL